jgi:thiamine-phosphate pyrophosphorylase
MSLQPDSDTNQPGQRQAALRIIDANRNRAAEGMRAVEEYCRFALDDAHLTRRCRELRHELVASLVPLSTEQLAAARDTQGDVGTISSKPSRGDPKQVAAANSERVKQALRAIEEYVQPLCAEVAVKVEALRYQWYTLEKAFLITAASQQRLASAKLYVLIDGDRSECAFAERAQDLIQSGVHILQLRDKHLDDRTLLARARLLRRIIDDHSPLTTHHSPPLLIINDRPDLAVLARADGVHVGQEELGVRDARRIVGPEMLIGVSTHNIEQARQAVLDGANYIGCGPTFPSGTKHFDHFPGLEFLKAVAAEISLPAFAIGGITLDNLPQVLSSGFKRVAIGGAINELINMPDGIMSFLTQLEKSA